MPLNLHPGNETDGAGRVAVLTHRVARIAQGAVQSRGPATLASPEIAIGSDRMGALRSLARADSHLKYVERRTTYVARLDGGVSCPGCLVDLVDEAVAIPRLQVI